MNSEQQFSKTQLKTFEKLVKPESNWPDELRERFEKCRTNLNGYHRNLDKEVILDYVKEKFN